jgi:hypothetical protein
MTDECAIIALRQRQMIGERNDRYSAECILPRGHFCSLHVICTPEDVYIAWGDDFTCGCCEPETEDRCTYYRKVRKEVVQRLIRRQLRLLKGRG